MKRVFFWIIGSLIFVGHVGPFAWQLITSFKYDRDLARLPPLLPPEITFVHYERLFAGSDFYLYVINSFIVALGVTLGCLMIGSMAAYSLARLRIWGRGMFLGGFLALSMFPQIAVVMPLYDLVQQLGLYNTHIGLIVTYTLIGLPLSVWLMYGFFLKIPKQLEEAAYMDGCGQVRCYWNIAMPLVTPGLVTGGLLVFIFAWNEFLFALTFTNSPDAQTIPVGIAMMPQLFYIPWGDMAAATILVTLPLIVLVLI
ncbi:carbohydrate ABC transporter permease, partial [Bacillaceae bacterium SIJ1]|uniref:carbohydrate ABC transporter permease n=1 Tax=Litoribacterium kuwaitense TaxID=1398745 RepID=UPI0013EA17D0